MFSSCIVIIRVANALLPPHNYSPANSINVRLDNLYIIVFLISLRKYINDNFLFLILKIVFEKVSTLMHLLHHKYKIKQ